jgi:hypothetical protein
MPFIRNLCEGDFEGIEVVEQGEAEYIPVDEYRYKEVSEKISDLSKATLDALRKIGGTEFCVNYDGGCDEGFAHPNSVVIRGQSKPYQDVLTELEKTLPKVSNIARALDELAEDLAARLLGSGYGTGEYTMYGAFSINLETLQMTDDPKAQPPEES